PSPAWKARCRRSTSRGLVRRRATGQRPGIGLLAASMQAAASMVSMERVPALTYRFHGRRYGRTSAPQEPTMARSNSTNPTARQDEAGLGEDGVPLEQQGPAPKDPRSVAAIDNIGVDDQADLLAVALAGGPGDREAYGQIGRASCRERGGGPEGRGA